MHLTRRGALALPGLLLAGACTKKDASGTPAKPDPDVAVRAAAVTRENALIAGYAAALAAAPALSGQLGPLLDDHRAHLVALGVATPTPVPAGTSAGTPAAVLKRLRALEAATSTAHAAAAQTASRGLAATLASLAACEASHVVVL